MYPDNQPSDASGAANLFGNLPPGVPGAGAASTGNNTQAGTTAQVPNAADAPEPTNHFVGAASMSLYHARQAVKAHHAAMLTENASMENGVGHQADNFEYIPKSNHFYLPHSNNLDLPRFNISDFRDPDDFLWLLDYNGDDEPIVDDKNCELRHPDEFERALLEDLEELPEDADSAFPAQQQLDEHPQQLLQPNVQPQQLLQPNVQPQQLLQPNVQQWQPQPNVQQWQPQPNVQQQLPQQKLDETLKRAEDVYQLIETRHSISPTQLQERMNQLLGSQQSASPAQLQQSAQPAMAQPTQQQQQQQQQQQSRASPFPQRQPDLHAMLEKTSIVTGNIKEVYAKTSECVDCVNIRVIQGISSRQQELATFQVNNQVLQWVKDWVKENAKDPNAPILRDTPPVPDANGNWNVYEILNGYNRSFSSLYLRAMSASRDLKKVLQGLPFEWIFGKGPDAVPEELRRAVIECHTLSLNTFHALLAFMEHDTNLLPHRFTDNWNFDVLSTINQTQGNQTQGQGPKPSDAIRYLTEKCHETILAHTRYVHSLLRDLYPWPVLPALQQVQAITNNQLQMLLQQQQEAARDCPMLSVCPYTAGPDTENDQIKTLEFCVFYRLNFILQRLPRV